MTTTVTPTKPSAAGTTTGAPVTNAKLSESQIGKVIDSMRSIQTETDRWELAETLSKLLPSGSGGFTTILDRATAEGVSANLSVNTLRLYRDTANRWASDKRVPNVSFSAHREAMNLGDIDKAAKLLTQMARTVGASKVTIADVRKQVSIQQGKKPKSAKATAAQTTANFDVVRDIENGAKELIAAIGNETDPDKLDRLISGLKKALGKVEALSAKAARAKASTKSAPKVTTPPASTPKVATASKPASKKAGDMRGL